ncbi:MAG: hypothetical protein WBF90_15660 [Rivularia sp. (in: cyanobacteria)]
MRLLKMLDELIQKRSRLFKISNLLENIAAVSTVTTLIGLGAVLGSNPITNRCARNIFYLSSFAAVSSASVTVLSSVLYDKASNKVDALYWEIEEAKNVKPSCQGCIYASSERLLPCAIHPKEQSEDCPDKSLIN